MGFGFKDWEGPFYPPGIPSRNYLAHYSKMFDTIELDTTFYGTPRAGTIQRWNTITPSGFTFCAKVPRTVTHEPGISHPTALGDLVAFIDAMSVLREKMGVFLIQFPPSFQANARNDLHEFLSQIPKDHRYAVEFRHPSWYTNDIAEMISSHGICFAATDFEDMPKQIFRTADFLYLRWIGVHGRFPLFNREIVDVGDDLSWWREQIQSHAADIQAVYGFFNNDYAGFSPATCNRFKSMIGLPVNDERPPQQQTLF
jgi:uncharacterized protein YecE (DUF72 family)